MIRVPNIMHSSLAWFDVNQSVLRLSTVLVVLAIAGFVMFGLQLLNRPVAVTKVDDFHARLDAYVQLRQRISDAMHPLRVTSQPADILGRELALGAAMQAARPEARQGDVFTAAAAESMRRVIAEDWSRRSMDDRTDLMSEVPQSTPRVNQLYPDLSPLATFPGRLLGALPPLPADLEYRFMARDVIIRDVQSNVIIDVLSDVITASSRADP